MKIFPQVQLEVRPELIEIGEVLKDISPKEKAALATIGAIELADNEYYLGIAESNGYPDILDTCTRLIAKEVQNHGHSETAQSLAIYTFIYFSELLTVLFNYAYGYEAKQEPLATVFHGLAMRYGIPQAKPLRTPFNEVVPVDEYERMLDTINPGNETGHLISNLICEKKLQIPDRSFPLLDACCIDLQDIFFERVAGSVRKLKDDEAPLGNLKHVVNLPPYIETWSTYLVWLEVIQNLPPVGYFGADFAENRYGVPLKDWMKFGRIMGARVFTDLIHTSMTEAMFRIATGELTPVETKIAVAYFDEAVEILKIEMIKTDTAKASEAIWMFAAGAFDRSDLTEEMVKRMLIGAQQNLRPEQLKMLNIWLVKYLPTLYYHRLISPQFRPPATLDEVRAAAVHYPDLHAEYFKFLQLEAANRSFDNTLELLVGELVFSHRHANGELNAVVSDFFAFYLRSTDRELMKHVTRSLQSLDQKTAVYLMALCNGRKQNTPFTWHSNRNHFDESLTFDTTNEFMKYIFDEVFASFEKFEVQYRKRFTRNLGEFDKDAYIDEMLYRMGNRSRDLFFVLYDDAFKKLRAQIEGSDAYVFHQAIINTAFSGAEVGKVNKAHWAAGVYMIEQIYSDNKLTFEKLISLPAYPQKYVKVEEYGKIVLDRQTAKNVLYATLKGMMELVAKMVVRNPSMLQKSGI